MRSGLNTTGIIYNEILWNKFDPKIDDPDQIPDERGVYIICAKQMDCLPTGMIGLKYTLLNGLPALYVGISGRKTSKKFGLRSRDYENHFNGIARKSTLRKSIGVLFGYKKKHSDGEIGTKKYRFIDEDEEKLSTWMKENLILHFLTSHTPEKLEIKLIDYYAPPLNIRGNRRTENIDFRKSLSELRCTL